MPQKRNMKIAGAIALAIAFFALSTNPCFAQKNKTITTAGLLNEMTSFDQAATFPSRSYTCKQMSSYDRRSVSPDQPHWYANDDGSGYVRLDTIDGRIEKVMFDEKGPGAVTRIWMTTSIKNGKLRFYFDGNKTPSFTIDGYDMSKAPFYVGDALSLKHTHYKDDPAKTGGNTFMLPMPYQKSCRITFEEPDYSKKVPRYYHVNYRTYPANTQVQTFSPAIAAAAKQQIMQVNESLLNPPAFTGGKSKAVDETLDKNKTCTLSLTAANNAIKSLMIKATAKDGHSDEDLLRHILLKISFDGTETVWVPVSDFAGAGFGGREIKSFFLSSDGKGTIWSSWVMPYRKQAIISIENLNDYAVDVSVKTNTVAWTWKPNDLYFHTSWKQDTGVTVNNQYDADELNKEWNFTTLNGKGVYRGDLITLYNHAVDWYGEGDEKIWVDDDKNFPSHFGTGTEDYYNCSWAPVVPFHTPFGGAPRADSASSHGYNSFLRTRNLDDIPFTKKLLFNLERQSWHPGKVDFSSTVFWYGNLDAKAAFIPSVNDLNYTPLKD